jgi:hypothetical protein
MDSLWVRAVEDEKHVPLPDFIPAGLYMLEESLVKPVGDFNHPMFVLSTYPTGDPLSSVHSSHGESDDLSNISMCGMYCYCTYGRRYQWHVNNALNYSRLVNSLILHRFHQHSGGPLRTLDQLHSRKKSQNIHAKCPSQVSQDHFN